MDIVDEILKELPGLYPYFKEDINYLYNEEGEPEIEINLGTKLTSLGIGIKRYLRSKKDGFSEIKLLLDKLEDYVKHSSSYDQSIVEVMFLEGMLWWAEDKESESAKQYGDYFLTCLGPKCRELCRRNKEFWDKLNRQKQERIDNHYAQLQREYEERKKEE